MMGVPRGEVVGKRRPPAGQKARVDAQRAEAVRLLAGLCIQCDATPVPGQRRCERHRALLKESWELAKAAKFAARWERQRRRAEG